MTPGGNGRIRLFQAVTHGIRVRVTPVYAPEHSDPGEPRYVFIYHIRIENLSEHTAQLLRRHWHIEDPVGGDSEVAGEGVVGETPVLAPGEVHEYQSYCVLRGPTGAMRGSYTFRRTADGAALEVAVPRFDLRAPAL
jgi:ApaG protein